MAFANSALPLLATRSLFRTSRLTFRRSRPQVPLVSGARVRMASTSKEGVPFAGLFPSTTDASVLSRDGSQQNLVDVVEKLKPAVVLVGWLRHYGCTLCRKQALDWAAMEGRMRECGDVKMVLVGSGSPEQAQHFMNDVGWSGEIVTDPPRRTYRALSFQRGVATTFNLPSLQKTIKSFREGNKQAWGVMPSDAFQQGGAVLVGGDGIVKMFHFDRFAGDHVPVDDLVESACAACRELDKEDVRTAE